MAMRFLVLRTVSVALGCALASGCVSDVLQSEGEGDDPPSASSSEGALRERWKPPASSARGTYEAPGSWNGGRSCAGAMLQGTQALGSRIETTFTVTGLSGYACRQNTANRSEISAHGTGRALDVFASPTNGDEVANWLVRNASDLGVQLVIWNRTLWIVSASGPRIRSYGGPNPHTDHVHAELTRAAANSAGPPPIPAGADDAGTGAADAEPPAPPATACTGDGDCNPGNEGSGQICTAGSCVAGCRTNAQCPGAQSCSDGQCH